jgi:membrane protease YdiL (CAAX protease family)
MKKINRKSVALLFLLITGLLPTFFAAVFKLSEAEGQYSLAIHFQIILAGLLVVVIFIDELKRQQKINKKNAKSIFFALIYALMLAFVGAAISELLAWFMLRPSSF